MPRATRRPDAGSSVRKRVTAGRRAAAQSPSADVRDFLELEREALTAIPSVARGIPGEVPELLKNQLKSIDGVLERLTVALAAMPDRDPDVFMSQRATGGLERFRTFLREGMPGEHAYVVLLGLSTFDARDLVRSVSRGLSYRVLDRLLLNVGVSFEQLMGITDIPRRTLTRRKQEGRLTPEESDRVLRASRLFGMALRLFEGNREASLEWLARPQAALGGATPWELAKTELGAREVEKLIQRLEHGVFA